TRSDRIVADGRSRSSRITPGGSGRRVSLLRTLASASRRVKAGPAEPDSSGLSMGRQGAFKDRPLWRRLQTVQHEIKEHRFPNASTLAKSLSVSTKTVQRDLDYMRDELEAPIEFSRDENGYF